MEITLSGLASMTADQLRSAIAQLDAEIQALHVADNGELRDLSDLESDRLEAKARLRERAKEHLRLRAAVDSGRGREVGFGGPPTSCVRLSRSTAVTSRACRGRRHAPRP
jgi:uncharacterized protein YcaQ